MATLPITMSDP